MLLPDKSGLEKSPCQKVLSVHLIICLRSEFVLFPSRILYTDFTLFGLSLVIVAKLPLLT
jgi:hypothetical protein